MRPELRGCRGRPQVPGRCDAGAVPQLPRGRGRSSPPVGSEVAAEGGARAGSERGRAADSEEPVAERSAGAPCRSVCRRGGRCSPGGAGEGTGPGGAGGPGALRHRGRAGPGVWANPAAHAHGPGRVTAAPLLPTAGLGSVRLRWALAAGDTERGRAGA